jgi:chromate reductase
MRILGICGSVRGESSNSALLQAVAALAPPGMEVAFYGERALEALPTFNPDRDGVGAEPPDEVKALRTAISSADGVLICTPEYAHGAPGALKNALDWIVSSGELEQKSVALISAAPGGGRFAQASLTPTLEVMGARMVANLALVFTRKYVNADGTIASAEVTAQLRTVLDALARGS